MNFNPFSNDSEDLSFEQGSPVSQAAKTAVKTTSTQAQKAIDDTQKDLMNQLLYGPGTSTEQEPGTDEANLQAVDQTGASHAGQSGKQSNAGTTSQPTDDQAKMQRIRRELEANYSNKFQSAPNGVHNITTNLEQEMEKARQERKQKEQQRKQEEEEEEKRRKEKEEEAKQELVSPAGKKTGFMYGKKPRQPIALRLAETKTEINRGTTG